MYVLLVGLLILLFKEGTSFRTECSPSTYPYTIDVTYKEHASSQAIEVFMWKNHTSMWITSIYGYGKDNLVESTELCLSKGFYQLICTSRLSSSWESGSYFEVKAFGTTTVVYGTVDVGKLAVFNIYPFNPITPSSSWKWYDYLSDDSWYLSSFDDSKWFQSAPGSFFPIFDNRYYRFQKIIPSSVFRFYSAFELYITHLYNIEVYVNNQLFISRHDIEDGVITYTRKREGIYSHFYQNLTVAIHIFSHEPVMNHTSDPFTSHLVFLSFTSPTSNKFDYDSSHRNDYYSHPLSSLFDSDLKTEWWFKGNDAEISLSYSNPLGEYVNQYTIASSRLHDDSDPRSWEFYGSHNNIDFILLDSRSDEVFTYRMEKRTFTLTNMPRNYRYFKLHVTMNNGDDSKTGISQFALYTQPIHLLPSLVYKKSYIIYFEFEVVHITPLSSGYSHFHILNSSSEIPYDLAFNPDSGTLHGQLKQPMPPCNITVAAENMLDHTKHTFTFTLEARQCNENHSIIQVEKWNQAMSSIEYWNLTNSEGTVITDGVNYYTDQDRQVHYYCIRNELLTLTGSIDSNSLFAQKRLHRMIPGVLVVSLPYPIYDEKDYHLVKDMSFYAITKMVLNNEDGNSCTINPVFSIQPTTEWKVNMDRVCKDEWRYPSYDDSTWNDYIALYSHIPDASVYCFRTWINVTDINNVTSYEIKIKHYANILVYINGEKYIDYKLTTERSWMTVTIPPVSFHQGKNLFAIKIGSINTRSFGNSFSLRCVSRFVYETEDCGRSYMMTVKGDAMWPYKIENLFNPDLSTVWKSDFDHGKALISMKMAYNSHHYLNKYCMMNSPLFFTEENDPSYWTFYYVKVGSNSWIQVDQQADIRWSSRLQTQCFTLTKPVIQAQQLIFVFEPRPGQTVVELSFLTFHAIPVSKLQQATLKYAVTDIGANLNVPIMEYCPLEPYFNDYSIIPELPAGLFLSHGTGCIFGTVTKPFVSRTFTISAKSYVQAFNTTTIQIHYDQCSYPATPLTIGFHRNLTGADPLLLEISLYSSQWTPIRISDLVIPTGDVQFTHCLPVDEFSFSINDYSAQGDLFTTWFIKRDNYVFSKGILNPGFPELWFKLDVEDIFDGVNTEWYYDVSGSNPPINWYKQIDPQWELWETSIPSRIPAFKGISQYFKTVLVLPPLSSFNAIYFHIQIEAGFVLYINGKEIFRFNLPKGSLSSTTKATDSFTQPTSFTVTIPVQFSSLIEERNIIAVETHLKEKPQSIHPCTFHVQIDLESDHSLQFIDAEAIDMTATIDTGILTPIPSINDGNYYNKYYRPSNCSSQFIHFFSDFGQPCYISQLRLFTGDSPESYPHQMKLYGRLLTSLHEIERAKQGLPVSEDWVLLTNLPDIDFTIAHYGIHKDFFFYNEQFFNEIKIELNDCGKQTGFEIGELSFFTSRVIGFCDSRNLPDNTTSLTMTTTDYSMFIPSRTWYKTSCPQYYRGNMLYYCNKGNWTSIMNRCKCIPPLYFKYPSSILYIRLKKSFSIQPKAKGAELVFFFLSQVPDGIHINHKTGEIYGVVNDPIEMMSLSVLCSNPSGDLETSLVIVTVNNHETLLVIVAAVMILLFVIMLYLTIQSMNHKQILPADEEMKNEKLHVDLLTDEMKKFLL